MNKPRWLRYVKKNNKAYFTVPNKFTEKITDILPKYVDSILEIGCTNGRDFKQFEGKFNLYGADMFSSDEIDWVCDKNKVKYYKITLETFLEVLDKDEFKDLSKFVFLSHFTLCYNRPKVVPILKKLIKNGCKNIIIKEPLPGDYAHQRIYLTDLDKIFIKRKTGWERNDSTHICCYVDNKKELIEKYLDVSIDPKL